MRDCPRCKGTGKRLARYDDPCEICKGEGLIANIKPGQVKCHWCDGSGLKLGTYPDVCNWCEGRGYRYPKLEGDDQEAGPLVFCIESGKPRTAHLTVTSLLAPLKGEIRICDPYYGIGTLARLDPIADQSVKFLTNTPDSKEHRTGQLQKLLPEFVKEFPSVEFRRYLTNDLHDRFIVCESELILLGHGLKDIGNKESFVIRLNRELAADTIDQVIQSFDTKWVTAKRIT